MHCVPDCVDEAQRVHSLFFFREELAARGEAVFLNQMMSEYRYLKPCHRLCVHEHNHLVRQHPIHQLRTEKGGTSSLLLSDLYGHEDDGTVSWKRSSIIASSQLFRTPVPLHVRVRVFGHKHYYRHLHESRRICTPPATYELTDVQKVSIVYDAPITNHDRKSGQRTIPFSHVQCGRGPSKLGGLESGLLRDCGSELCRKPMLIGLEKVLARRSIGMTGAGYVGDTGRR